MGRFGFWSFWLSTDEYEDYQRPQDDAARPTRVCRSQVRALRRHACSRFHNRVATYRLIFLLDDFGGNKATALVPGALVHRK
jgi:hypothetical protein